MADNETIKAFECCYVEDSRLDCNECPIKDACNDFGVRDAIKDLNNCLKAEIERPKENMMNLIFLEGEI